VEVIPRNDRGSIQIECEVTAAKDAGCIGRKHLEYLNWPSPNHKDSGAAAKNIILAWCYATKVTSPEEIKRRQQARQGFDGAWLDSLVGRDVLGFVKASEYEGKLQAKIQGNVWAIDDSRHAKMPGWAGVVESSAVGGGNSGLAAPSQTGPYTPATDPFAGLL
jgi:hypothetical protein